MRPPLTNQQLDVLRWVGAGCPERDWPDHRHKQLADTLPRRNLVAVSRYRGVWSVSIKPDGRHYLQNGDYPPGEPVRKIGRPNPGPTSTANVKQPGSTRSVRTRSRPTRQPSDDPRSKASPTDDLMAQIIAAGGALKFDRLSEDDRARVMAQLRAAERYGKVPSGALLRVDSRRWDTFTASLTPLPDWVEDRRDAVPVPDRLTRPHAEVAALRDDPQRLPITGRAARRALQLLQALGTETTRLGGALESTKVAGRYGAPTASINVALRGHRYGVRIGQKHVSQPHTPTKAELAEAARPWGRKPPRTDSLPTDALVLSLEDRHGLRPHTWAESDKVPLEVILARLVYELQIRAFEDDLRDAELARRRAAEEQARAVKLAQAKIEFVEQERARRLRDQLSHHHEAREMRAFAGQVAAVGSESAVEWATWIREYADGLDPLSAHVAMPEVPEPTPSDLPQLFGPGRTSPSLWNARR